MKYTIGVDLGGTNIAIGLCDEALNIVDKGSTPTLSGRDGRLIVRDMAELAKTLIERNSLTLDDIKFVGIASPGSVDVKSGKVNRAFNLGLNDFPIADIFKEFLPVSEVRLENDANAAALGEALAGAARGTDCSVAITLGTGVGGGIIINKKIFSGGLNAFGAEIGHSVINVGGRQCTCGRRGCFEAYCSATALTDITRELMTELEIKKVPSLLFDAAKAEGKISARTAFTAMKSGDIYGKRLVDEYIMNLGEALSNIVNIFQPEVICIGGGVCNEGKYLVDPLVEYVNREQYTRDNEVRTKIVVAKLGNDAGIIGAAAL